MGAVREGGCHAVKPPPMLPGEGRFSLSGGERESIHLSCRGGTRYRAHEATNLSFANQGGNTEQLRPSGWGCFCIQEEHSMSYGEKVLSKLNWPGVALMVVGAVLVYASSPIVTKLFPKAGEKGKLICKGVGCVIALVGALLLMDIL